MRLIGYITVVSALATGIGVRWLGMKLGEIHPCRTMFVLRVLVGVIIYVLCAAVMYLGFLMTGER